ncbi:MAG: 4Fe-4S binding protein, partial [Halioglobus sp.]
VSECTGCDLCVEPCPVDCIDMIPEEQSLTNWHWQLPDPVSRKVDIIATDAQDSQDRAA